MRTKSTPNPHARKIFLATKVNSTEMQKILGKALKHYDGNVSAFTRDAALHWRPKPRKK